jgi:hypothetical protein
VGAGAWVSPGRRPRAPASPRAGDSWRFMVSGLKSSFRAGESHDNTELVNSRPALGGSRREEAGEHLWQHSFCSAIAKLGTVG